MGEHKERENTPFLTVEFAENGKSLELKSKETEKKKLRPDTT